MPAKTHAITGHEANCLAAADHFIACRGSKPATRIRARFDRIDQAEAVNRRAKLTPYRRPILTPLCCVEIRA